MALKTGAAPKKIVAGAIFLGVGLAGFIDGILLHQLLQWHHLGSARINDPDMNILLDGLFHGAMLVLLIAGLVILWRGMNAHGPPPGRDLAGWILIGAGVFHVFDAVAFHWIFVLHRINPHEATLFWDIVFFGIGLVLLVLGARLIGKRRDAHVQRSTGPTRS